MASILTGEQMISCRARLDRELPTLGFKEFQPTKCVLEQQHIEHALEERKVLLNEDRIEKCGNLSAAEWKPELVRAQVTRKVGKHWEVFGHYKENCEWLFPEEALFMLETNSLELSYDGVPVSVQKGYAILINNSKTDCTLSEYRVYSHLSRQGYRVVRHLPDLTVTSYEKQINLDQYILDQKRSYDVERKQTFISMSERTASFSESENKEDISNISEDIVSRIMESNFEMLVPGSSKLMDTDGPSNMPSTSGIVSHDVVVLDESTVDSDVIEESLNRTTQLEEEDDLDVIEVPQEPKEIIIETIDSDTSSEDSNDEDNDDVNEDSSSDSDSDIHWKRRRSVQHRPRPVEEVDKKCAVRSNYATIQEFLFDRESAKKTKPVVVIDLEDEGNNTIDHELKKFYNEIELIDLASDTENETSYIEEYVKKNRREILDGMPVMNIINGYVSVTCPDLRLIPENTRPRKHEYTLLISRVRGERQRPVTNYRNYRNHNQHRNYHGRGYQNMNSLFNRMRTNPWSRQGNVNPALVQQATQIQTLAQGMIRFASSLMNQMCQPQVSSNNNWNMNMPRFNNPAWRDAEMFTQNALVQRNFYSEQRNNENPNYSVPQFGQNSNPYQQHQTPVQSCNNYRSQYAQTPVNNYTSSVSNENSPVRHVNVNNFSPSVNSYSQNSNSSVENMYEVNNREYSPSSTRRYNSPNKRFHRWGGGVQRGGGRARQSLQSRHATYHINSMTVEENRRSEDPAYSREDVPLRGDGFIPLTSNNNTTTNNNTPRSNFQNNRRRRNREIVNIEDDDVAVVQTPRKRVKQENNQARKKQGRKRYFSVSPVRKIRKQEVDNEDGAEIIDIDVTPEELDVKQDRAQEKHSVLSDKVIPHIADVKPNVSEAVNESVHHMSNVKFENTDVKSEKSSDTKFLSDIPSVPVKSETTQDQQQQQDDQHSTSTTSRKLVKDTKRELSQQLDTKSTLSVTQNTVEAKISERLEVKTESCLENQKNSNNNIKTEKEISCSDDNRIENNSRNANEIKQEPLNAETTMETENCSGDINESEQVEDNVIKQASLEENINVTDNCEKNNETAEESNRAATSWAEFKNRPISVGGYTNYEESDGMEDTVEDETEGDDIQPIVKPEDCKNIASILSALQIFNKGEAPHYEVCRLKISFDMYLPSSTFKKVQRTLPNYRIVIVESLDPLPSPSEVAELRLRFQDSVQILLAVVMPDSIAFYTFSSVCLPVDDTSYKI